MATSRTTATQPEIRYDQDYYLWLTETAEMLRQRRFSEIDIANLIEEIEDMGRSEKRALRSNLRVLLVHLLKYCYQSDRRSNSWRATIREHRKRLRDAFQDSPSLSGYFEEIFQNSYADARELAMDETGMPIDCFPLIVPFSTEQVLDPNYLPEPRS